MERARVTGWNRSLLAMAVATAVFYLAFSLYYVTHSENLWRVSGEQFLKCYPGWDTASEGDAALYNREALGILHTGVPRDRAGALFLYAPVYAYFLAGCYWVGGIRQLAVTIPQAILAGMTCWFIGLTTRRMAVVRPQLAMLLTTGLMLIYLRLAMYTSYVNPTILLLFWLAVAVDSAARPLTWRTALLFGVVVALGALTQAGFSIPATAMAILLFARSARQRAIAPVIGGAIILLAVGARLTTMRINAHAGEARGGEAKILWEANNPYYESMRLSSSWERRPGNPWTKWQASAREQERYASYKERARQLGQDPGLLWIRENPAQYAKLCLIRLRTELGPYTGQMSPKNRLISTVFWLLIFPAGAWGLWIQRRHPVTLLAGAIILTIILIDTLVIVGWDLRYRLPVDFLLLLFAGIGYSMGWECKRKATP
jgi:hypothetical protein